MDSCAQGVSHNSNNLEPTMWEPPGTKARVAIIVGPIPFFP